MVLQDYLATQMQLMVETAGTKVLRSGGMYLIVDMSPLVQLYCDYVFNLLSHQDGGSSMTKVYFLQPRRDGPEQMM